MSSVRLSLLCSLLLAAGLLGCDTTATQPESQVVVEAYLQANAPLDTVWLTRTVGAREQFDEREAAVEEATVEVEKLDDNTITTYSETGTAGVYAPDDPSPPTVEPQTSYRLRVETNDGTKITSTTTVPDAFTLEDVENTIEDTAEFQNDRQQPAFRLAPPVPQYEQDRQNVYFFTLTSQLSTRDSLRTNLTPFYAGQDPDNVASFRTVSSNLLNEANFSRNTDGTVTVDLPWLGVAFFGPNEVGVNVVDDNYYDFLRSDAAQENAPPGEFPNVIEHIEGGTGIFASYARQDTTLVFTGGGNFLAN